VKNYLPTEGFGGKYSDFTERIQGFPYLPSGMFPIWLNHGEMSEMLMSLKIHCLKWQIKVLLRKKQLENRRSRDRRYLFLG